MTREVEGPTSEDLSAEFGANTWLVEEMLDSYRHDPSSVDETWRPVMERLISTSAAAVTGIAPPPAPAPTESAEPTRPTAPEPEPAAPEPARADPLLGDLPIARTTAAAARQRPVPADLPKAESEPTAEPVAPVDPTISTLRGLPKTLAANMDASLSVPTATSVRTIPAKLLIDNRIVINNQLTRSRGGKISFTHLIGWALVKALVKFPSQNVYYDIIDGKPSLVAPAHVTLGLAIDLPKPDGTRSLMVPGIKNADTLNFLGFVRVYEELVARARAGKLTASDFTGVTVSLTNPGGIGTVHSVPRLMKGQGCIIGAGALEYPAEFQGTSDQTLNDLGISKTITLTSTYDHRVIQGAGSGEFLKIVHDLLLGADNFYDDIFAALRIPYEPVRWVADFSVDTTDQVNKTARVQELIHAYRVRGHLIADTDPLEYRQRKHPDLDVLTHGLSLWDLDREFVTGGFGGRRTAKLRDVLGILRDTYCRTTGIEYMHLQDPEKRLWLQDILERPYAKPTRDEQLHILSKLNQAEAFETFLQTKFVGQKRFSLEGSESIIALIDQILQRAAGSKIAEAVIGMAHRGRLNVLTNIAGKTYAQMFREFEGTTDPRIVQGSGDVKYHLGTEGEYMSSTGESVAVYLTANPSHLEAVDGPLLGIARAKQDLLGTTENPYPILPVLVHGDAAFAGQGVVYEVLQMSQLRAYKTGGSIHVMANNQIGFTTKPSDGRTSVYPTDVGRAVQVPIFHVNGDDPEAVMRVAHLAVQYRQRFHTDVIIDLVCYRRRGHNEGDDPSMTQPLMYGLIEAKRSIRALYAESLIGRGDITVEEYEKANRDFHERLERAFLETHAAQTGSIPIIHGPADLEQPVAQRAETESIPTVRVSTTVPLEVIKRIGDAHNAPPEGFTIHPKVAALLKKRFEMSRSGKVDWAFAELLALGSLLLEGTPVRLAGQDTRRGTFVQRHAVMHDRANGQEWFPLANLSTSQAPFWIYDSLLSEYAALGFEYGYSVERTDALVAWEAQFGDFTNGAQVIVDEFISSAEQKWQQHSGVVLLLPHGYEGQGPDHSSARIERFLTLAAENNMTIAHPSSPASYFHLLRRQAKVRPHRPLVVFTPKSMLRMRDAVSPLSDFTQQEYRAVLDDDRQLDKTAVKRVVMLSGKLYWEALAKLEEAGSHTVALVRLEQFYPLTPGELNAVLDSYPNAKLVWAQEEPQNQGAWPFFLSTIVPLIHGRTVNVISRPPSASPAAGSNKRHSAEQAAILEAIRG